MLRTPQSNKAFWRAVHSLVHPITILGIILLLLNDHWLRLHYPSWLTGKLGDAAWLLFAPFILAALLAWIVPKRLLHQERIVRNLSISLIGLWFLLAKTNPTIYHLTITALDQIAGWHGTLGMDTSDLIVLPILFVSIWIWKRVSNTPTISVSLAPIALGLGLMGTVATSCLPPETGVTALCRDGNTIYGTGRYPFGSFVSTNGGLSWKETFDPDKMSDCFNTQKGDGNLFQQMQAAWLLTEGKQTFRFVPGSAIYSYGANQTEKLEVDLREIGRDVRKYHYEGYPSGLLCGGRFVFSPGPLDAVIDPDTGNLVVAMGLDGILVRDSQGVWQWVTVGDYSYDKIEAEDALQLIVPELIITFLAILLLPLTITFLSHRPPIIGDIGLIFGWLLLGVTSLSTRGFGLFSIFIIPGWISILTGIVLNWRLLGHRWYGYAEYDARPKIWIIAFSIVTALLYLLPFALWIRGSIPVRNTAESFSLILAGGSILAGIQYLRWRFPTKLKKREPQEPMVDFPG